MDTYIEYIIKEAVLLLKQDKPERSAFGYGAFREGKEEMVRKENENLPHGLTSSQLVKYLDAMSCTNIRVEH